MGAQRAAVRVAQSGKRLHPTCGLRQPAATPGKERPAGKSWLFRRHLLLSTPEVLLGRNLESLSLVQRHLARP